MNSPDPFALPIREEDLAQLELCLRDSVIGDDPFLNEVASHLIQAGGKRLRPSLTHRGLVPERRRDHPGHPPRRRVGRACPPRLALSRRCHGRGDPATQRRERERPLGQPRRHRRRRFPARPLGGDRRRASGPRSPGCWRRRSRGCARDRWPRSARPSRSTGTSSDYLRGIADKTAALMSTACRIGALTAGLDRSQIDDLSAFGEAFGMVFQIRDDVLDVVATESELGKPPGQDLAEGIYTLPVQRALLDPAVGPRLRDLLGHPLDQSEREEARALVAASSGISAAHEIARDYAEAASSSGGTARRRPHPQGVRRVRQQRRRRPRAYDGEGARPELIAVRRGVRERALRTCYPPATPNQRSRCGKSSSSVTKPKIRLA